MPAPLSKSFTLRKNAAGVLAAHADLQLNAPAEIADLLASNGRFPASLDAVRLADVQLGVATGDRAVTFASGLGGVTVSAEAGAFGGFGAYRDAARMLADLADIATGSAHARLPLDQIPFPQVAAARYCVLYSGYSAKAAADGSVALAPGAAATFGAHGARRRALAVVQAHADEPLIHDAVRTLFDAWRLPSQVRTPDDLPPGAWIVAETAGGIQANAGVRFGLDFNWIRSIKGKGLQGDIGLKIQAGANAAFGLTLSDRFAVVVGRDSLDPADRKVRVRLHRLDERGWSFAASAKLTLTGSTGTLLPAQMDDFLAATLGVHGMQTLAEVRRWTDSSRPLSDVASDFLSNVAKERFGDTLEKKVEDLRALALSWFDKWDALPAAASSALWDVVRLDEDQVKSFVAQIQKLASGDEAAVQAVLADVIGRSDFADSPLGSWLELVAPGRVLGALANLPQAQAVSDAAAKTLDILNGGWLQQLKTFVDREVGLAPVREAIAKNDFKTLSATLQSKLADFLGVAKLDSKAIQSIRETITAMDGRAADLYAAAVKALNDSYRFTFDYAYQRSSTKTALLDVVFDFAAPGAKKQTLSELLRSAIAGDFRGVLPPPGEKAPPGVRFYEAALTHHIQRSASVKITLPFFDSATIKETSSLARFELAAEDGGVYMYSLEARDDIRRKDKWRSTLSLGLNFQLGDADAVRRHDRQAAQGSVDYRFTRRLPDLRTAQLERLLDALGPAYFPHSLGGPLAPTKPSAHEWALALDRIVDGLDAESEDGLIGDALMELEVSLPGETVARWLQAPADRPDMLYMNLSRRIQQLLRKFIPFLYFQDVRNYGTLGSAYPLLVYASLPVTTSIRVRDGRVLELDTNRDVYWDWVSASQAGERRAMILDGRTAIRLGAAMASASKVLESAGDEDLRKLTRRYAPTEIDDARRSVLEAPGQILFESLLFSEANVISSAVKAGVALAKFREKAHDPEKAIEELAAFGERITRTFHEKLQTIFKPKDPAERELLRNLGVLVFAEASETLPPSTPLIPVSRFDLTVFKRSDPEAVSIRQSLVE